MKMIKVINVKTGVVKDMEEGTVNDPVAMKLGNWEVLDAQMNAEDFIAGQKAKAETEQEQFAALAKEFEELFGQAPHHMATVNSLSRKIEERKAALAKEGIAPQAASVENTTEEGEKEEANV